jgi:hypothetical protein
MCTCSTSYNTQAILTCYFTLALLSPLQEAQA